MTSALIDNLLKELESFISESSKPLIILLGSTASGKTKLSLHIAKAINGEIISADSRQIYKNMDIGTDIILPEEQDGIKHHMLAFLDPNQYFSLADYKYKVTGIIKEIHKRKKIPMMVGGTGLYINAVTEGYEMPKSEPNFELRKKLQKEYEEFGAEYLHKKLEEIDPEAAANIHPNNVRYVIRALEINQETKSNKQSRKETSGYQTFFIGLDWSREILYERINQRVDLQIRRGLVEEVTALSKEITNPNAPAFSSLGCKEILEYLRGNITLEEAIELVKKNTRNYAKRQLTWFRRNKNVHWLNGQKVEEELNQL